MYKILLIYLTIVGLIFCNNTCAQSEKHFKQIITKASKVSDTLSVGYTYWWTQSGPFIGYCGEQYGFVFLGTIQQIDHTVQNDKSIHPSQKGSIKIDEVLVARDLKKNRYSKQKVMVSDCFYEQDLREGDQVLVFCYEYEENYSIPGRKSLLKVNGNKDPLIQVIKRYILSGQDALMLKEEMDLWKLHDLETEALQLIRCKEAKN
ncbi:hypothetical protein GCM10022393_05480 [Aquimarina addita]|uniref:Uncharacterized protein n=1 Tax=Aquimarina addita TaxID=870485 RepID=A0ABP7XA61_9FLAO